MKQGKFPWKWIVAIVLVIGIKWFSVHHPSVERYYSNGVYPPLARLLRTLFGWLPFSLGDALYVLLPLTVIWWLVRWIKRMLKRQLPEKWGILVLKQAGGFALTIYICFYTLWGLNYSRLGVRDVLKLDVHAYETAELVTVMEIISSKLTAEAALVNEAHRDSLKKMRFMRAEVQKAYDALSKTIPELSFSNMSLKRSLFGRVGNYTGFSGYLNPFTNEAHLNRTIPWFYQPAVACHEIAHQIGISSEAEANFVGYLSCKSSPSAIFRYSIYYDMFFYGMRELRRRDSTLAKGFLENAHPQVKKDRAAYKKFLDEHRSVLEPMVDSFYDAYLRANEQSSGIRSYDEVIGLLMAWYRKYGLEAI
ncbi:DUF3810 domain-containing protein [Parasegetibacter sp. NRK P23]|uniref:DUF3810 domain-containing protein n=1 Tax=Parasegetibacter sp. NRK P23 TaxID=2942999 RepID=UPI002043DEF7|nr:DUF3810 domain-containing protein [Parasegetibacter sp. NRK P23]MCM5528738.1 DUF3810 domain-containing protein [Parasegetibacter sp. NRK P23]